MGYLLDDESYSSVDEAIQEETYNTYKAAMEPHMEAWYVRWARENRQLIGETKKTGNEKQWYCGAREQERR